MKVPFAQEKWPCPNKNEIPGLMDNIGKYPIITPNYYPKGNLM